MSASIEGNPKIMARIAREKRQNRELYENYQLLARDQAEKDAQAAALEKTNSEQAARQAREQELLRVMPPGAAKYAAQLKIPK